MAKFVGTEREFQRYIGNRMKDLVKKYTIAYCDAQNGVCQECGRKQSKLTFKHTEVKPKELRSRILKEFISNKFPIITVDLEEFFSKYISLYDTDDKIRELGKCICKECKEKLDNNDGEI